MIYENSEYHICLVLKEVFYLPKESQNYRSSLQDRYGPGCSKLMTPLVNVSLKFQKLITQISQYFLLKKMSAKASLIFSTKI